MRKRLFAFLCAACLLCNLCACGSSGESGANTEPGSYSPPTTHDGNVVSNPSDSDKPTDNLENLTAFERLFANGSLPAQDTNELWGYIDSSGNWIIPPTFKAVKAFWSSGLALAQDTGSQLWGLIDTSGQYITEPAFGNVGERLGDGLFRVGDPNRGWGYIDTSGAFVIEPQFDVATDFSNGFARVSSQIQFINQGQNYYQLWGYINISGERITEDIFSEATDFYNGVARVKRGDPSSNAWEYIDTNGNSASPNSNAASPSQYTSKSLTYKYDAESGLYGYVDSSGDWILPPQYIVAGAFLGGIALVQVGSVDGMLHDNCPQYLIDTSGNYLMEVSKDITVINWQNREHILVKDKISEKIGCCNLSGDILIDCIYDEIQDFAEDYSYIKVRYDGLWGIIDKDGNWLIPAQFLALGA